MKGDLDIAIRMLSGSGRLVIPALSTKPEALAVVRQLRVVAKLIALQAKHLPDEIVILDGDSPEGASKIAWW